MIAGKTFRAHFIAKIALGSTSVSNYRTPRVVSCVSWIALCGVKNDPRNTRSTRNNTKSGPAFRLLLLPPAFRLLPPASRKVYDRGDEIRRFNRLGEMQ